MKQTIRRRSMYLLMIVIIVSLIITGATFARKLLAITGESIISIVISAFETLGLLISLIIAVRQLDDSKEISRASFIVDLNRSFVENQGNTELYTALQNCLDSKCDKMDGCDKAERCNLEFPKIVVSNYLTFFETIYLLEKNGAIDLEMIDDLFAYRFFLAVHSRFVQQEKLAPQPENFKNIFCLEHEWMLYREKVAHKIDKEGSVFKTRPLRDLMKTDEQKRLYESWIKECRKF